jgi:hypothetical protein
MKKILLVTAFLFSGFIYEKASAQVHLNVNIGSQPVWGPTGYDHVEYYYLPDIDAYYYVPRHQYVYLNNGQWVFSTILPTRYHDYDVYSGYKVVVNEPRPYLHNDVYRSKYGQYKGRHDQEIIRNSHDSRYFVIKDHPEHDKWEKENRGHNGNGNGNGNGKHDERGEHGHRR